MKAGASSSISCGPANRGLAVACFVVLASLGGEPASAQDEAPLTRLFDTVVGSSGPTRDGPLAKQNTWRQVPEDNVSHSFSGDAVLLNDKLVVIARKAGRGIEVWSRMSGAPRQRATLGHAGASSALLDPQAGVKIIQNTASGVTLEAGFQEGVQRREGAVLRIRLTTGEAILEVQSPRETVEVEVRCQSRYVVVPDYFGDDLVYDPQTRGGLYLPAENFCLNLLEGGDAMIMSVWQASEQDAWLAKAGPGNGGLVSSSRVRCPKGKSLWLAFLESPGLWHGRNALGEDGWKPPFPAKWRASLVRENEWADSWDMEVGPGADQGGAHGGPLILYALDRSATTPLTVTCPTDIMRNTLGVGPCQYILACEGLAAQGDPTPNSVMGWVEKQFEQKRERKTGDEIRERLELMVKHVADARARIGHYAEFAAQLRKLLGGQPGPFLGLVEELERVTAAGQARAVSPDRAKQLADEVAALAGQTNALAVCQRLGKELRAIGAVQDRALAKCRMDVRRARQQARTLSVNPSTQTGREREIVALTERTLLNFKSRSR